MPHGQEDVLRRQDVAEGPQLDRGQLRQRRLHRGADRTNRAGRGVGNRFVGLSRRDAQHIAHRRRSASRCSDRDKIVALRQDGLSVAGIAKKLNIPHGEVHATMAAWSAAYFGPNRRSDMLAIVTARLERLYQAHREKAYKGNSASSHIVLKCCAHLSALHGLYQPAVSALNVNNTMMIDATPRQTSADGVEAALNQLILNPLLPAPRGCVASCA